MQAVYSLPANLFGANGKLDYDAAIAFACSGDKTERHSKWSLLKRTLHQSLFEALKAEAARRRKLATKKSGSCKSVIQPSKAKATQCDELTAFFALLRPKILAETGARDEQAGLHICPID